MKRLNLKSGEKLPVQHREYRIDQSKIDKEKRTLEILFSTDDPASRWYGDEILDHSPGACDLRRLNDGGAFLKDHDSTQQIGVHESASIAMNGLRGEGRALIRFAPPTNALAEQEFQDVLAGIRSKISVGYVAHEMQLVAVDEDENETWRVTKWEPLENSLVAIPLDPACGVGRSLEGPDEYPVRLVRDNAKISQKREITIDKGVNRSQTGEQKSGEQSGEKNMEAETKKNAEELEAQERANNQKVKDRLKLAREREKEIRAIAKKANKNLPEGEIEKAVDACADDDHAVDNFRKLVFDNYFGDPAPVETPTGRADIKVVGERLQPSVGSIFVNSDSFKKALAARGMGNRNAGVDMPISVLGIRGKVEMAKRAGFTSSDLSAINIAPQQQLVALGVQRLTILDLIAPGTTSAAAIPYPRENSFGTVNGVAVSGMPRATSVGERGIKPIWEPDLTTETASVKKIAVVAKVPEEFLSDFQGMQSFIDERMPYMVDMETEAQCLYGDGLGNNLKGILSTAGVQTRAYATSWGDTIMKALTDVRVGSFFEPDGIAMHPYDWETARLEKDDNDQYLGGGPFFVPYGNGVFMELNTFWGKPVAVTTSVAEGRPVVGAWRLGAQYFIREGMRLESTNSNEDDFRRNLIAIRAEHRLALAVYRPISFVEVTGGPARS